MSPNRAFRKRAARVVLLAVCWLVLTPVNAQAHASLVSTAPAAGESLGAAPTELVLHFDEPVAVGETAARLVSASGRIIRLVSATASPDPAATQSEEVHLALPELADDQYLVRWSTTSIDDYHVVAGTYAFGIGVAIDPDFASVSTPSVPLFVGVEALLRFGGLAGLAGVVGAVLLLHRLGSMVPEGDAALARMPTLARRSANLGWASTVGLGLLLLARAGTLPSSRVLVAWLLAVAGLVLAGLLATRMDGSRRRPPAGLPVAVCLSALGLGVLGHGATRFVGGVIGAAVTATHILATCAWLGGTVLLAVLVVPELRAGSAAQARRFIVSFAGIAAPALAVSLISGLLLASAIVPSEGALVESGYGRTLLAKLGLVALAAGAGGLTFWWARRREHRSVSSDLRTSKRLTVESWLIGGAVLAAALLATSASPTGPRWAPTPEDGRSALLSSSVDGLFTTVRLSPGTPGSNFVLVGFADTRRPARAPVESVRVSVAGAPDLVATPQGEDVWVVPSAMVTGVGVHEVLVTVQREGVAATRIPFEWRVAAQGSGEGGRSLRVLWLLAAGMVVGASVLALLIRFRRRRRDQVEASAPERSAQVLTGS